MEMFCLMLPPEALDSQDTFAYVNRAISYTVLGMDAEAQQDVKQAVQLGFDHAELEAFIDRAKQER